MKQKDAKSRKFLVYCDSGANIHSRREEIVSLDYLCISPEEWEDMSESEKDDEMRDVAFDKLEWGYHEIEEGKEIEEA